MKAIENLGQRSRLFWATVGLVLVAGVGVLDLLTGCELAFSLFYLAPISLVTWFAGRRIGIPIAVISAIIWFGADIQAGQIYSHPAVYFWNTTIRLAFFLIVTLLVVSPEESLGPRKGVGPYRLLDGRTQ